MGDEPTNVPILSDARLRATVYHRGKKSLEVSLRGYWSEEDELHWYEWYIEPVCERLESFMGVGRFSNLAQAKEWLMLVYARQFVGEGFTFKARWKA